MIGLNSLLSLNHLHGVDQKILPVDKEHYFSANKISYHTVELLRKTGWITEESRYESLDMQKISDAASCLVMGAIAEECSSPTMPPITANPTWFALNCNFLLQEIGSVNGITFKENIINDSYN